MWSAVVTQPHGVGAAVWGSSPAFFTLTWVVLLRHFCSHWWRGAGNGNLNGGPLNLNFSSEIKWLQKNTTICLPKSLYRNLISLPGNWIIIHARLIPSLWRPFALADIQRLVDRLTQTGRTIYTGSLVSLGFFIQHSSSFVSVQT